MDEGFKRAGVLIIGNEILNGHVTDTNSGFLCKRLHAIGVKVCRLVTVGDDKQDIAEEVARLSEKFDLVITTGGIGPTHDDITYEAIAAAFGDKIVLNAEIAEVIRAYFGGSADPKDNPALKMAQVPQSSNLIYVMPKEEGEVDGEGSGNECSPGKKPFPVIQVRNVYILPGIMEWLEHAFHHLQRIIENSGIEVYTMTLYLKFTEVQILNQLNAAVSKFANRVLFGSYPAPSTNVQFATKIIIEGSSLDEVTSARQYLKSILPKEAVVEDLQTKDAHLVQDITHGTKSLSKAVRNSLKVINAALRKYQLNEIYLSFNGGKDCTVLLHLVWATIVVLGITDKLNCVYIKTDTVFEEVNNFVTKTAERYGVAVAIICGPIKEALTKLHSTNSSIKAIFMGTRRTDPHSENLKEFQMCDKDWPSLMRVNPILDWTYDDIWNFLRVLSIPYCSLYDEGYTSIGNSKNTRPNEALRIPNSNKYLPAYCLKDGTLERQGRK